MQVAIRILCGIHDNACIKHDHITMIIVYAIHGDLA